MQNIRTLPKAITTTLSIVLALSVSTGAMAQDNNSAGIPNFEVFTGENIQALVKTAPALSSVYDEDTNYVFKSDSQYIEIVNRIDSSGTPSFVITGQDASGHAVPIKEGDIRVEAKDGSFVPITFETMEQAKAPVLVSVLMDMSGSMAGQEKRVATITNGLFKRLASHMYCQAITFGSSRTVYGGPEAACSRVKVPKLTAGGNTPVFGTLEDTLTQTRRLKGVQQIVLVITDGEPTDNPSATLKTLGESTHIVFFWVGSSDGSRAQAQFEFIADSFIAQNGDPYEALARHVADLDQALRKQVVIHTPPPKS